MLNLDFGTTAQACSMSSSQTVGPSFSGFCSQTNSGTLNIFPAVIYRRKIFRKTIKLAIVFKSHQFLCVLYDSFKKWDCWFELFLYIA